MEIVTRDHAHQWLIIIALSLIAVALYLLSVLT